MQKNGCCLQGNRDPPAEEWSPLVPSGLQEGPRAQTRHKRSPCPHPKIWI